MLFLQVQRRKDRPALTLLRSCPALLQGRILHTAMYLLVLPPILASMGHNLHETHSCRSGTAQAPPHTHYKACIRHCDHRPMYLVLVLAGTVVGSCFVYYHYLCLMWNVVRLDVKQSKSLDYLWRRRISKNGGIRLEVDAANYA